MRFPAINRRFIKGAEFKARQLWLDFADVAGTVLGALEPVKAAAWEWFEKWKKGFLMPVAQQTPPAQPWLSGMEIS